MRPDYSYLHGNQFRQRYSLPWRQQNNQANVASNATIKEVGKCNPWRLKLTNCKSSVNFHGNSEVA